MGRRPASAAVLRAVVGAVLVMAAARAVQASPVLDDEALARGFVDSLGRLVEAGGVLEADAAREQLATVADETAVVPASAASHRIAPRGPLYDAVLPAVVAVGSVFKCDRCSRWHLGGVASGWLASPDGLVVTNHHVMQRESGHHFGVMTSDGAVYGVTGVVAADAGGDAAVVRIDGRGHEFPCLGITPGPASGTPVSVISHPKGRFYCLTEGVVSRYHRQRRQDRDDAAAPGPPAVWMSVTADYAMGSSGGPVFDAAGRVVGMVSRTATLSPRPRPAGAGNAADPAQPPPQMIFKDCVSAQTLQRLLGADDRGDSPPPDAERSRAPPQRPALEVGDPAPRLQVGEWVQGEPVTEFRGDQVYLIEFWATWCGPCKEAIPHLDALQKRFRDRGLVVIGQGVNETDEEAVKPLLESMGDTMSYRVARDDTSDGGRGWMAENWLAAAGQTAIPWGVLVDRKGTIAWMGRPTDLDESLIAEVLAGTFDSAETQRAQGRAAARMSGLTRDVYEAIAAKDWARADAGIEEYAGLLPPAQAHRAGLLRVALFIAQGDFDGAARSAEATADAARDDLPTLNNLAAQLARSDDAAPVLLDAAERIASRANLALNGNGAASLVTLARVAFLKGDPDKAVELQARVVALSKPAAKPRMQQFLEAYQSGRLPDATSRRGASRADGPSVAAPR